MTRLKLPKYCIEDKDRYGNFRIYLRKPGHKKVRLEGVPWSTPFMDAYAEAMGSTPDRPAVRQASQGTFGWLCQKYYESAEFKMLEPKTRITRRQILDRTCKEPIKPGVTKLTADYPVASFPGRLVRALRDRIADTPGAANNRTKAIRQVFSYGIAAELCDRNPARDVPYLETTPDGFHMWTPEEVEQFEVRHPIGTKARLAMALMLYTSQRRSDAVVLGKQHIKNGWLVFTQQKNRKHNPIRMQIPIRPELQQVLDASPLGDLTFLVTEFGKPFTANGFGNWFRDRCVEAGVPGRAHGLRKAAASRLANLGATEKEIMAITGHTTSKEVTRYTKGADQRVLAERAMGRKSDKGE
jgi:integrase